MNISSIILCWQSPSSSDTSFYVCHGQITNKYGKHLTKPHWKFQKQLYKQNCLMEDTYETEITSTALPVSEWK